MDFSGENIPGDLELTSAGALRDPSPANITLDTSFLQVAPLKDVITETHFAIKDLDDDGRMGRLVAFLGRTALDGRTPPLRGVGVYYETAVVYEAATGMAKVVGDGNAYFLTQPTGIDTAPYLDGQGWVDLSRA